MLNDYSRRVESALLQAHPWLQEHIVREHDGVEVDYSLMYVPCPHGGERMYIYTDNEEITVGRGAWHTHGHFDDIQEQLDEAIDLIAQIVSDQLVPVDIFDGKRWLRSDHFDAARGVDLNPGETAYIRFWNKETEVSGRGIDRP